MKKISEVLRTFRSSREMTTSDLAEILDCSNQFISKLELGVRTLSIEKVKLLKEAMTQDEYEDLVVAVVQHKLRDLEDDFEFEVIAKDTLRTTGENKQKELNFGSMMNTEKKMIKEETLEEDSLEGALGIEVIDAFDAKDLEAALSKRIAAGRIIKDIKYQLSTGMRSAIVMYDIVAESK